MITLLPIQVGEAAVDNQQLLVQLTEALCQAYSTSSSIQPQYQVTFTPGIVTTEQNSSGTSTTYDAILPITITWSITYVPKNGCRAITKLFTETFTVGFTDLTTAPTSFAITTGMQTSGAANVKSCNKAYGYNINTAITIMYQKLNRYV